MAKSKTRKKREHKKKVQEKKALDILKIKKFYSK